MAVNIKELVENETDVGVEELAERLNLEIINRGSGTVHMATFNVSRPGLQFAGYYEHFSSERVQIVGEMETSFLLNMPVEQRKISCENFCKYDFPCLVITTVLEPIKELVDAAVKNNRVVLRSKLRTTAFVNELSIYLNNLLAPTITIHGVLVDLYGVGVLIVGHSSVGKSEAALELIQRGHRLVADDAVCLKRVNDLLVGSSPVKIRHMMEIRGLGIIDVEKLYGSGSIRQTKTVDFVACLEDWNENKQYDRLGNETHTYNILDIDVPEYIIPVRPGRNLASILEAAARSFRAKSLGYNVLDELSYRMLNENKLGKGNNGGI